MACPARVDPDETWVDCCCTIRQHHCFLCIRRGERDKGKRVCISFLLGASGEFLQSTDVTGISPITVPTRANGRDCFAALREEEQHRSGNENSEGEVAGTLRKKGRSCGCTPEEWWEVKGRLFCLFLR